MPAHFQNPNTTILIRIPIAVLALLLTSFAVGDGVRDNAPGDVRPIPPIGNDLDPAEFDSLHDGVLELEERIQQLQKELADRPDLLRFLPDVQIYYNAVRYPLAHHETINVGMARRALSDGLERASQLASGLTPWITRSGARGYVSRIDGSVQPYVLNVPSFYKPGEPKKWRLDVWGHGRDELLTELRFVEMDDLLHELKYLNQPTEPSDRFILSLYGRYINAYRFAGEVDGLEAMDQVCTHYPIDLHRRMIIGFSLGGTGSWQYAVHFPSLWAAASPAAGFAEAQQFLRVFQKEDVSNAPWYQQVLWRLYDATDYAENLFNVPTVAYGGELDPQRQASEMMVSAASEQGVNIRRIVGIGIGHHYTPEAKAEIDRLTDQYVQAGRNPTPDVLRFTTWTLKYNQVEWLTVNGLEHHWRRARVDGRLQRDAAGIIGTVKLETANIDDLTICLPSQASLPEPGRFVQIVIDQNSITTERGGGDSPFVCSLVKNEGNWREAKSNPKTEIRKRHNLQGPIDDAFMERFVIVKPTASPLNPLLGKWENAECVHAIEHWFKQFRGEAIVKNDSDVTDDDIAQSNLILFGDPSSNSVIKRIANELPIQWTGDRIKVGGLSFASDGNVLAMIYPNPLDPSRYVVLNSGFTYREYDYLNNARQSPKLPDYAVIDITTPPSSQAPGRVVNAGFFGERWELLPDGGRSAAGWSDASR